MKKSVKFERKAMIGVLLFIATIFTLAVITGVDSVEELERKEAEKKDVGGYREKVDKAFEKMAEDVIKHTKQTETADNQTDEFLAMVEVTSSLDEGYDVLFNLETPYEYEEQEADVMDRLWDARKACSDVTGLYAENKDEEAYDKIQDVIDKFAEAQNAKNKMFGYE